MRTVVIIFSVLLFLGAIGGGAALTWRNFNDGGRLSELEAQVAAAGIDMETAKAAAGEDAANLSASKFMISGTITAIVTLLVFVLFIMMFTKNSSVITKLGLASIALTAVMVLVNPSYETGKYEGASERKIAMVVGALSLLAAGGAMVSDKLRVKKVVNQ